MINCCNNFDLEFCFSVKSLEASVENTTQFFGPDISISFISVFHAIFRGFVFLDTFAELCKVTFSFVMCVCQSVGVEHLSCHWMDFYEI